jgi:dethiobiotin synthetase
VNGPSTVLRTGFFVTGTDTGVGKTQVAGALLSLLARAGQWPYAYKPYETGVRGVPPDAAWLRACAGNWQPLETVCIHRFRAPLAPAIAGRASWKKTLSTFASFGAPVVVEGAGGLRVPLDPQHDVVDLAAALKLPIVLVARAGLGTLNHVALSMDLLEQRQLEVRAIVLVKSTRGRDPAEADNPAWLRRRHRVPVLGPLPFIASRTRRHAALQRLLAPLVTR